MSIRKFKQELTGLLNSYSIENRSNTPDFILADYLVGCLKTYEKTHNHCKKWHTSTPYSTKRKMVSNP